MKKTKKSTKKKPKNISEKKEEPEKEDKEVAKKEETKLEEEIGFNGIESLNELRQILKFESQSSSLENIQTGSSLEGGLIFAPRIKEKNEKEGVNYSNTKYESKYDEGRYAEKTPGYTSKESNSSDDSKENQ